MNRKQLKRIILQKNIDAFMDATTSCNMKAWLGERRKACREAQDFSTGVLEVW